MSPAERLTRSLRGQWHGAYGSARCPAHDDHSPSLSIADGNGGRLLLKCHRGCDYEAIRSALDLPRAQVSHDPTSYREPPLRRTPGGRNRPGGSGPRRSPSRGAWPSATCAGAPAPAPRLSLA